MAACFQFRGCLGRGAWSRIVLAGGLLMLTDASASRLYGQVTTVQQPVFGVTSVNTTVSVPDRGRVFLGGVNRSRESRGTFGFGPRRFNTNTGFSREAQGTSVGVFIHDFEAMDRMLLGQAPPRSQKPVLNSRARHAYESLLSQQTSRARASRRSDRRTSNDRASSRSADRAALFWRLGQRAEQRGASSVAKLHYRMAVKHGSQRAQQRLEKLK